MKDIFSKLIFGLAWCVIALTLFISFEFYVVIDNWDSLGRIIFDGTLVALTGLPASLLVFVPSRLSYARWKMPRDKLSYRVSGACCLIMLAEVAVLACLPLHQSHW